MIYSSYLNDLYYITLVYEISLEVMALPGSDGLYALTSVSVLVKISNVADCQSKHGVIGPIETDGPSLIVPVAEGV